MRVERMPHAAPYVLIDRGGWVLSGFFEEG
jgi:hypothetical protein